MCGRNQESETVFILYHVPHLCVPLCAGIDFKIRTIELDGKRVKLQIW